MHDWLIGVDPGLITGLAFVERDNNVAYLCAASEVRPEQIAPAIRPWLRWWGDDKVGRRLTVVIEAYIVTQRTAQLSAQPWSLEHIGLVKQCMRDAGMDLDRQLVMQKPAVKSVVDNDKLRRIGLWYRGGAGHANDAIRHTVVHMINTGWRDPRLLASG